MFDDTGRRRFLELAGTGTALSLAGCSRLRAAGTGDASGEGDVATVTVGVEPDEAALQRRRAEIRTRLRNGTMTRSEAQRAFRETRTRLMQDAVDAFERRASDHAALTVDDTVPELGAVLVTGGTSALVGTLSAREVSALLPEAAFEKARSQAGEGTETSTGTPE